jgi:hypothetical protein
MFPEVVCFLLMTSKTVYCSFRYSHMYDPFCPFDYDIWFSLKTLMMWFVLNERLCLRISFPQSYEVIALCVWCSGVNIWALCDYLFVPYRYNVHLAIQ